mgnify:CR=1 FL=1|tara:strand:+ start:987 stop:1262 length:276 start_codon:yes stop_codon:yes gene_type:complete
MTQGYTLLELLLTITIIALLCVLAIQSYANAKRKAQITACQIYKKQIDTLKSMPEYNNTYITPKDINTLVKIYDRCYECHASANIPFYYAQ